MRAKVAACAVASCLLFAGAGCSSPQPSSSPLGDPPPGLGGAPVVVAPVDAGSDGGAGAGAGGAPGPSSCDMYAQKADASNLPVIPLEAGPDGGADAADDAAGPDAADDAAGPDAAPYVAPLCVPLGDYPNTVVVNTGNCPNFPAMMVEGETFMPAQGPFPTTNKAFVACSPPLPAFTDGNCTVFIPPGTVCSDANNLTYTGCGFITCAPDGSTCTIFQAGTLHAGTPMACEVIQQVTLKR